MRIAKVHQLFAVLLFAASAAATTGCVSEPWEGQEIGNITNSFRSCGYLPSQGYNIALQRFNFRTGAWETIGRGSFDGSTRVISGHLAYGWRNDSVAITRPWELWRAPDYWRPVSFGSWRRFARFRAIDLNSGVVLPQQDKNSLEITGSADFITIYGWV